MARIETFINEDDLLQRIHLLRREHDITNQQLTIITNSSFEHSELNEDIKKKNIDGNVGDKFMSFFSANDPENRYIAELGLSSEQIKAYSYAIEHHHFLLYIDSPDFHGADQKELKNVAYSADTEVIDMNKER